MTRSLCQEVTKNWHSIPSNRTTACSGSNVSVDLGIVSLTLGNSRLPVRYGLTRHHTRLGKVLLRHTEPLALYPNTGADSSALHGPSLISELLAFTVAKKRWLVCQKSFTSEMIRSHCLLERRAHLTSSSPARPIVTPTIIKKASSISTTYLGKCVTQSMRS